MSHGCYCSFHALLGLDYGLSLFIQCQKLFLELCRENWKLFKSEFIYSCKRCRGRGKTRQFQEPSYMEAICISVKYSRNCVSGYQSLLASTDAQENQYHQYLLVHLFREFFCNFHCRQIINQIMYSQALQCQSFKFPIACKLVSNQLGWF